MGRRIRGRIQDWTLYGRYSGRCTDDNEANFAPIYILPFPFLGLNLLFQASPFVAVLLSFTIYIDTIYVL